MKTVILDFVNVVADLDIKKAFSELSFKQKIAALRLYLGSLKKGMIKMCLQDYQRGVISRDRLVNQISLLFPSAAKEIPNLLDVLMNNLTVNEEVLDLVEDIRKNGSQVLLMSNSIPETEEIMKRYNLDKVFDGLILSTKVKAIKPFSYIYSHAISEYNVDPKETIMLDDTKKNLLKAESLGIETFHCGNSNEVCEVLEAYLVYQDMVNSTQKSNAKSLV